MKCQHCKNETVNLDGACDQCKLNEKNHQTANDSMDDDWDYDDDEPNEPDYWECYGCGRTHARRPFGGRCDICDSIVEEGYW